MPPGIKSTSAYCQKFIEQTFQCYENVHVFQDDILIGHKESEDDLNTVRKVLNALGEAGLTVNINKCKFFQDRISYIGFDLTKDG